MTDACEVLVVGLGPVGATLAALLGDAGVDVLAIDRSAEVYPLPRAAHFSQTGDLWVVAAKLPMRQDVVTEPGDPARILANAPKSERNFFIVPKVVE